jgi:hypothetical protein
MTDTNTIWLVVGLAVLALAIAVGVSLTFGRRRARERTTMLRERFGPEYNRTIKQYGGKAGERILAARVERVDKIEIHELSDAERQRFTSGWTAIQQQFIDDPAGAVGRANELIKEVMRARGYSADAGFEQRAADLSVDHPDVVQHYRAARALAQGGASQMMNTEELRQAVVHYRALFADLLQAGPERVHPIAPGGVLRPA